MYFCESRTSRVELKTMATVRQTFANCAKKCSTAIRYPLWAHLLWWLENCVKTQQTRGAGLSRELKDKGKELITDDLEGLSLRERMRRATRQMEREIIHNMLERHHWNRRRTAESLKISYRSLMYKMKSCNLRDGSLAAPSGAAADGMVEIRNVGVAAVSDV